MKTFLFGFLLLLSALLYGAYYLQLSHLGRMLTYDITIGGMMKRLLLTTDEVAHRPSRTLERARQLFLKYPFQSENLQLHQAMALMSHVLWRELERCNYPLPSDLGIGPDAACTNYDGNGIYNCVDPCHNAHQVAYTIAAMVEADNSTENLETLDFWHHQIWIILEENVLNTGYRGSSSFQYGFGGKTPRLDPDRIRSIMDFWLEDVLKDVHHSVPLKQKSEL